MRTAAEPNVDEIAPLVPWADLVATMGYRFDESVTLVGPPGRGKTTVGLQLLELRKNAVIVATKPNDKMLEDYVRTHGYRKALTLPNVAVARRVVVWPKSRNIGGVATQKAVIGRVLDQVYEEGNRAIFADEVHYLAEFLHMGPRLKMIWTQGRSNGISLIAGFQRPAWVPRDAYSSATHLFLFGSADDTDAKALGGIGGLDSKLIRHVVKWLAADASRRHEFLYLNTRTGNMVRSRFDKSNPTKGRR